ncbi:RdgB/HAM1 family non-canonical purine NTP pyrophosphatase [Candidatus Marinimicrobia bacterium]|jgi:XTP/dITP diphosphohydrolase|nr:RdgB/HAM1 family non-canonical purine NTP pyrophosphatase [Candidatus Neomarinimicrobiota bacterium]
MKKIVVATHNINKQKEINAILKNLSVNVLGMEHFPNIESVEETGSTLFENSLIKSRTVSQLTGLAAIADDTGLEVDALDGAPGVFSARYAGPNATCEANVEKLLYKLKDVPEALRIARFRTVISYVDNKKEFVDEGVIEGMITFKPSGNKGFGYDPVFKPLGFEKTFSEISQGKKNKISHRALALKKIKKTLKEYLNNEVSID